MSTTTPEALAAASAQLLRLDPPPTEAEIDEVLDRMSSAFGAVAEIVATARKLLHSRFAIRMDMGQTLTSEDGQVPWLDARRGSIEPFYWSRYRELLLGLGWPPLVVATLDRSNDELLDLLGNPADKAPWQRRGLVMGDVQSGKTASYAGLICKAADADYRMIILLTGTLENVRRQTQERLDHAFIGFDSRDYLGAQARHKRHVGVGLIDGRRDGVVFTSRDRDFRKNAASALNISLESIKEPVLVVTKKNKGVLERLSGWLRARNADRDGKIDLPLLMIDDEADNASINTRQDPDQTTAINKAIRDLLSLFRRSSYIGFTATPFANIFIDPSSTAEMLGDDLFPRDFIHVLEQPTNYVGMNALFPGEAPEGQPPATTSVRTITDGEDWLPEKHDKDFTPGELPDSLRAALCSFLLACAIRDLRAADGVSGRGGPIHRSMLVNVSRFTAVQDSVADALHVVLEDIRRSVRLHGALPPEQAASQSPEIAALAVVFEKEFSACGAAWPNVLAALHEAIAPVRVQAVNQRTGAASLDYAVTDKPPGVRVIAVGGNSLSRGLTLEGLSTSYFRRDPRAYDTLLQMGRWFGFRDGYLDLCRVWLTEEAEGWYKHVTRATGELKRDFARMRRMKATPREFGLRVRTHPDTVLLITARNKMSTGMDVDQVWDISLMGRMIESARLHSDRRRNEDNIGQLERFFERLGSRTKPEGNALVWRGVQAETVADLLEAFLIHPLNFDFQGDSIATFLRDADGRGPLLSEWTVALPVGGEGGAVSLTALPQVDIKATKRKVKLSYGGSLLVSGKSARVGSRSDLRPALSAEQFREAAGAPEDELRRVMKGPLLVIYLLRGYEMDPGKREIAYRDDLVLPALGLHFPGTKDPDASKNLVRYRLNRVAQKELMPDDPDAEDDLDDTDPDD
jgi:hypothetical protein